jgi:hypothetical protein
LHAKEKSKKLLKLKLIPLNRDFDLLNKTKLEASNSRQVRLMCRAHPRATLQLLLLVQACRRLFQKTFGLFRHNLSI